ncbi:hypothetical protein QLQ15_03915 [Lysobacter sp. LF1]|uniref:GNAT family N-acetyltransferase n=1 Tax=Lysobacter stagni TaxID=3045172 RepID=A0ABT6XD45_9GAMM|nr:hypothetical protein [Lysobacter sp. LF1]MDI9238052.1 hypothetical protein [Lysobacter sp. LF1]
MNASSLAFHPVVPAQVPVSVRAVTAADADRLLQLCEEHQADAPAAGAGLLEFHEALFEAPVRAWAWLAFADEDAIAYTLATVAYSLVERGYVLHIDALHVRAPWPARAVEAALFAQVDAMARRLGCVQLQWRVPSRETVRRLDTKAQPLDGVTCALDLRG